MSFLREALSWLLLILLISRLIWKRYKKQFKAFIEEQKAKRSWSLNPKSPDNCPACGEGVKLRRINSLLGELPPPGETVKGPGGSGKTVDTEGQCCDNSDCHHHQNRDASVHSLMGSGVRGPTREWTLPARKRVPRWKVEERLQHGQLVKKRKGRKLQTIRTQIMCGSRPETVETLEALGYSSTINTWFVERFNLTLSRLVVALVRHTTALAQTEQTMMQRL